MIETTEYTESVLKMVKQKVKELSVWDIQELKKRYHKSQLFGAVLLHKLSKICDEEIEKRLFISRHINSMGDV